MNVSQILIIMKKSLYLFTAILVISVISCKGQSEKSNSLTRPEVATPAHITKTDFLNLVMDYEKNTKTWVYQGEMPCLIDFYADWCAPCHIASPILEDLARKYAGEINIYKVDIEKEKELASVFGVQSIPTFLFCPMEGNPTISSGIANSPEATRNMFIQQIEELLLKKVKSSTI